MGFEIFAVSKDNTEKAWKKAIAEEKMKWLNFIEKERAISGKIYGVTGIPANYLISSDGKILAKNLRGHDLDEKLKELFGK